MEHAGHRERLRRRYRQEGLEGFAPHEALELLLTYAIPRVNTNPLAHALISRFGSLGGVLEASPEELEQVPGIGPQASTLLNMLVPLLRMYEQEKLLPRRSIATYADLAAYCRTLFLGVGVEQFYVLCLDAKLHLIAARRISQGTPSEVSAQPRMVVHELMRCNAVGAVICHNHPSGSPLPSQADVEITWEIQNALRSVDIRLYDHVIIAGNKDYSFVSHGMLDGKGPQDAVFPNPLPQEQAADTGRHAAARKKK